MNPLSAGFYPGGLPAAGGGNPYAGGGGTETYTGGPVGSTIPGQQFNSNQQLIAQGNAQMAANSPFSPQQQQATEQAYNTANAQYVSESTPMARQDVIDQGTNLGAMQGNYNSLAQQLAAYDNMVLKPEFTGTNPGMPTDMPYNPDIYKANVSYLTPESAKLPYQQGIYNANPEYALSAQTTQRNSIIDVLNTLNSAMSKELGRGKDIYGSRVKTAAATLEGLGRILGLNSDLEMKRAELALRREELSASKKKAVDDKFQAYAERVKDDLQAGRYSAGNPLEAWGKAFQAVKSQYPQYTDDEINAALGGRAYKDSSGNWIGEGNANKDSLVKLALNPAQFAGVNTLKSNLSTISQLKSFYDTAGVKGNPLLGPGAEGMNKIPGLSSLLSYTDPSAKQFVSNRDAFITGLKSLVGESGVLTNQDVARIQSYLPNIGDNPDYAARQFAKAEQEIKRTIARNQRTEVVMMSPNGKQAKAGNPDDQEVYKLIDQGWKVVDY